MISTRTGSSDFCVGKPSEVHFDKLTAGTDLGYSKDFDVSEIAGRGP